MRKSVHVTCIFTNDCEGDFSWRNGKVTGFAVSEIELQLRYLTTTKKQTRTKPLNVTAVCVQKFFTIYQLGNIETLSKMHKYIWIAFNFNRLIGLEGQVFANGPGDRGSIPGRVIPKTLKMVFDTSLLNTQ